MPNWCENELSLYGKTEEVEKILNVMRKEDGEYSILESLYPTPQELNIGDVPFVPNEYMKQNKEKLGYTSWYDWRISNWGCKWPENYLYVDQEYTKNDNGTSVIHFKFETPWGPPIEAFNKISEDYPNILFCLYYEEPGMGFCGKNVWADGECKESEESELITHHFDEEYLFDSYIDNK